MESTWDPDWDFVDGPLSAMRQIRRPRLRNRTKSEPSLKRLIPERLAASRFEQSFTARELAMCREEPGMGENLLLYVNCHLRSVNILQVWLVDVSDNCFGIIAAFLICAEAIWECNERRL